MNSFQLKVNRIFDTIGLRFNNRVLFNKTYIKNAPLNNLFI